jgi:hypothetical protein
MCRPMALGVLAHTAKIPHNWSGSGHHLWERTKPAKTARAWRTGIPNGLCGFRICMNPATMRRDPATLRERPQGSTDVVLYVCMYVCMSIWDWKKERDQSEK